MKMTNIKKGMLGSAALLLSLVFSTSLFAAVNVDLEVQSVNGANVLVVTRNNSQCADANSGYIDFMTCDNDLRDAMMKLKDFNSAPGTVYYEVTAENCMNPNEKIYLDPRIENKG